MSTKHVTWSVIAYTQGARWALATGLASRSDASRVMAAIVARDGMTAADSCGRMTAVTMAVEEGE